MCWSGRESAQRRADEKIEPGKHVDFRLLVGYGSRTHTVSSLPLRSSPLEAEHYSRIRVAASTSLRAPLHSHKSRGSRLEPSTHFFCVLEVSLTWLLSMQM